MTTISTSATAANPSDYDVVVVGAGVIGASVAFHLAERGKRVIVVEARPGHGEGSTGLSFASVRAQWADRFNARISWESIQRWRSFEQVYGIDVGYQPNGYLLLFPEAQWASHQPVIEMQQSLGIPVEALTPEEAQSRTSFETDGIGGASWGAADGQVDPHGANGAFLDLARARGAEVLFNFAVDRIEAHDDGSWTASAGKRSVRAQHLVNAAGGWAGEVGALAGFEVPIVHSRRNVFSTAEGSSDRYVPMTIDLGSGVFLRSEGSRVIFGATNPDEPNGYNTQLDWEWVEGVLMLGYERFPWLAEMPLDRNSSWAGTYENTPDHHAIIGAIAEAPTWVNAAGFSGHGMMQAPEVGRIVAETIIDGASRDYDISSLSLDRFRGGRGPDEQVSLVF
ncbi:NAD(P)/FAD-dependent oxidoreductase [Leucobacter sp. GX24907]